MAANWWRLFAWPRAVRGISASQSVALKVGTGTDTSCTDTGTREKVLSIVLGFILVIMLVMVLLFACCQVDFCIPKVGTGIFNMYQIFGLYHWPCDAICQTEVFLKELIEQFLIWPGEMFVHPHAETVCARVNG